MPVGFSVCSYTLALCLKSKLWDWKIWHNIILELHFHPGLSSLEERLRVGQMLLKWTAQCPQSSSILTITTPCSTMTSPSWNSTAPSFPTITSGPFALQMPSAKSTMVLCAMPPAGENSPTPVGILSSSLFDSNSSSNTLHSRFCICKRLILWQICQQIWNIFTI